MLPEPLQLNLQNWVPHVGFKDINISGFNVKAEVDADDNMQTTLNAIPKTNNKTSVAVSGANRQNTWMRF